MVQKLLLKSATAVDEPLTGLELDVGLHARGVHCM